MEHLIRGLMNYTTDIAPGLKVRLAPMTKSQRPELLLVTCSDSRVVPHLFTSAEPGEVFVVRTVGNLVAPAGGSGLSIGDVSEASAIEYALEVLGIEDIAVCGHSNCGAMNAVIKGRSSLEAIAPNLVEWLAHAEPSRARLAREPKLDPSRPEGDRLSQANVLQQLEHIATFAPVRKRLATGQVRMHGLWFDLEHAMVSLWEPEHGRFVPLDEAEVERLLAT